VSEARCGARYLNLPKTARIRTSEAKSARTELRRRTAPRGEAHNPKLCGAAEVSGKEGNLKTVEIRIDTALPGESHGEVTSDKNQKYWKYLQPKKSLKYEIIDISTYKVR